jgi:hypothetical protein
MKVGATVTTKTYTYTDHGSYDTVNPLNEPPFYTTSHFNLQPAVCSVTKAGGDNPGWRAQIRAGQSAGTAYSVTANDVNRRLGMGSATYMKFVFPGNFQPPRWVPVTARFSGNTLNGVGYPVIDAALLSKMEDQVKLAFLKRARNKLTSFQGGTFLGELVQTIHGIRHPADGIKKLVNRHMSVLRDRRYAIFKPNSFKNRVLYTKAVERRNRQAKRVAQETWLETQFHLRPLIADAKAAAESLSENLNKFRQALEPVSASGNFEFVSNQFFLGTTIGAWFNLVHNGYDIHKYGCRITGAVKIENSNVRGFDADLWGFNPSNFVPTLWELLPWSWLIDYFSNVGDVIAALSFPHSSLAWHSQTTVANATRKVVPYSLLWASGVAVQDRLSISGFPDALYARTFSLNRRPDQTIMPSFRLDLSKITSPTRLANVASALSLQRSMRPY